MHCHTQSLLPPHNMRTEWELQVVPNIQRRVYDLPDRLPQFHPQVYRRVALYELPEHRPQYHPYIQRRVYDAPDHHPETEHHFLWLPLAEFERLLEPTHIQSELLLAVPLLQSHHHVLAAVHPCRVFN